MTMDPQEGIPPTEETRDPEAGAVAGTGAAASPEATGLRGTEERTARLCVTLADALRRELVSLGAGEWQITPVQPEEAGAPSVEKQSLLFALLFSGRLGGQCVFVFGKVAAAALGGSSGKAPAAHLLKAFQAASTSVAAELTATYGELTVTASRLKALPSGAIASGRLQARTADGAETSISLFFDAQLKASLEDPYGVRRAMGGAAGEEISAENLELVLDVPLDVTLRFGQRQLALREVLELASGSVVELDRQVDEPVELILDGRVIARGEAVIVDGNYGVRVTEVLQAVAL
jgi:flagellar motor switch protein FliN/FliY